MILNRVTRPVFDSPCSMRKLSTHTNNRLGDIVYTLCYCTQWHRCASERSPTPSQFQTLTLVWRGLVLDLLLCAWSFRETPCLHTQLVSVQFGLELQIRLVSGKGSSLWEFEVGVICHGHPMHVNYTGTVWCNPFVRLVFAAVCIISTMLLNNRETWWDWFKAKKTNVL